MTELFCDIIDITWVGENEYFLVYSKSENKNYTIPAYQLSKYNVEVGQSHYFRKEQNSRSKQYYLNFVQPNEVTVIDNKHYKVGFQYEFDITSIDLAVNKKGENISIITVEDLDKNKITVLGLKWQKKEIWTFTTLFCEVESILKNGTPRLINKDYRHPLFEIGKEYGFKVIEYKTKETGNGKFDVFILKGIDDCLHEVNMLPGQKILAQKPNSIECKVVNITGNLRLFQTNIKDPFYVTFEEIVHNKSLEEIYFTPYLVNNDSTDKNILQFKEQYNSKEAFWVFTYANKLLTYFFRENIKRQDYKKALEINKLIIIFEDWIISNGIITAFPNEEIRQNTKLKAKSALESAYLFDNVLNVLCTNPFDFLDNENLTKRDNTMVEKFYYLINFSNIELIEVKLFLDRLKEIFLEIDINSKKERYYLIKLLNHINSSKNIFISEEDKQNFSLYTATYRTKEFNEQENKYLLWSYCEILISKNLSLTEHLNFSCGQLLKLFTKTSSEISEKEFLLFHAYHYFENYQSNDLKQPFFFDNELKVNYILLENNSNNKTTDKTWSELEDLFKNRIPFTVQLSKKSQTGYEVNYNDLKGFLPYHHITDNNLKSYHFEDSSFSIEARCLAISRPFNFFIIEQTPDSKVTDNCGTELKAQIGIVYEAMIKQVAPFGLFLITSAGEGLLHHTEVFEFNWDTNKIDEYFKVGQRIKVVLKEINEKKQLSFSFRLMKGLDILYYEDYIERLLSYNTIDFFDAPNINEQSTFFEKALIEKAFCIEQFAVLQFDITLKLQNFQIAKQFYTNANHARSYLINIYTSYFEILLKIKDTIQNKTLNEIINIKKNAVDVKVKINQRTIETFPDSEKLVFFLDILSLFNEKNEESLEQLFDYIKRYSINLKNKDLRTIAKITLANNLLISESNDDSDFIFKNLRLIYDYLSNGILSLEESIEDKNARELKEEVYYWQEKIKEDESETLEFKSSLYTPMIDENALKRYTKLSNMDSKSEKVKNELRRLNGDLTPKILIHSSLKTLVAFANSSGGTLLIGVDNNKNIIGLEREYQSGNPKLQYSNRDGFGLYFDDLIRNYIGDSFSSLMSRKFLKFQNGDVLIVNIKQSPSEVFLLKDDEGKDCEQLYIRNLSSSKELTGLELAKFIKNKHFGQLAKTI